jgi:hypothetical protein
LRQGGGEGKGRENHTRKGMGCEEYNTGVKRMWNFIDKLKSIELTWDNDYGCNHRRGWSITYRGCVIAELEKYLIIAIWKAIKEVRRWEV